jgi:hypothetical protein
LKIAVVRDTEGDGGSGAWYGLFARDFFLGRGDMAWCWYSRR